MLAFDEEAAELNIHLMFQKAILSITGLSARHFLSNITLESI